MRFIHLLTAVTLVVALLAGTAAFSMPNLFSMPMLQGLKTQTAVAPGDVPAETGEGPFTLSLSGNVYLDKIPVNGAEVAVYVNGVHKGKSTAGDLYMFKVPGVNLGDTIKVEASYEGSKGSATDVVKFKNMYLDVYVKTDKSFIRSALEMLTADDSQGSQQQAAQQTQQPATSSGNSGSSSGTTTSGADARQLTSKIWGDTSNLLGSTMGSLGK